MLRPEDHGHGEDQREPETVPKHLGRVARMPIVPLVTVMGMSVIVVVRPLFGVPIVARQLIAMVRIGVVGAVLSVPIPGVPRTARFRVGRARMVFSVGIAVLPMIVFFMSVHGHSEVGSVDRTGVISPALRPPSAGATPSGEAGIRVHGSCIRGTRRRTGSARPTPRVSRGERTSRRGWGTSGG